MHRILSFGMCFLLLMGLKSDNGFRAEQLEFPRVRTAFENKEVDIKTKLRLANVQPESFDLYVRAFKQEGMVEVWAKNRQEKMFTLISTYAFCSNVGDLGPKREQGDNQIPEGFYEFSLFNPNSNYHLSLKVNYPNKSDSLLSPYANLGGQIFVHGGCLTIGCIPITDDKIEELYVLAVLAKDNGQNHIPIHIFPNRMNYSNYKSLLAKHPNRGLHIFWTNLRPIYQHFEQTGRLMKVKINHQGRYLFNE
ncbi:MAG: murein L,D-transpeptidase YafK [Bacteroidia bacterium]|jgi:murein L,D-transpeptidase YafK